MLLIIHCCAFNTKFPIRMVHTIVHLHSWTAIYQVYSVCYGWTSQTTDASPTSTHANCTPPQRTLHQDDHRPLHQPHQPGRLYCWPLVAWRLFPILSNLATETNQLAHPILLHCHLPVQHHVRPRVAQDLSPTLAKLAESERVLEYTRKRESLVDSEKRSRDVCTGGIQVHQTRPKQMAQSH